MAVEGAEDVGDLLRAGPLDRVTARRRARARSRTSGCCRRCSRPSKIVCIGLNYRSHAAEAGLDPPETPTFFAKWANALAAPGAEVALPAYSEKVDYEAEVAFVIGADGDVAGYTLFNDLSARDYQFKTPQWMPGKVFDGSAPCGPALVTPDEAGPHDAIEIELKLNGEMMQSASTADLIHSVPELVAYLSTLMTLEPGDIVATGTPAGRRQYPRPARLAQARRRDRDQLADARRARDPPRVALEGRLAGPSSSRRSRPRGRSPGRAGRRCGGPTRAPRWRRRSPCASSRTRPFSASSRTEDTDWSRLRSNCSASRITPQSTSSSSPSPSRSSEPSAPASGSPLRCQRAISAISTSSRGLKPGSPELRIR